MSVPRIAGKLSRWTRALVGSTGSTDNAILRANGTSGTTVQGGGAILDDDGNILTPTAPMFSAFNNAVQTDVTATAARFGLTFKGALAG